MIQEYDHVLIRKTGVKGIVVDIYFVQGKKLYTVEHDDPVDGYYQLETCEESDLEII